MAGQVERQRLPHAYQRVVVALVPNFGELVEVSLNRRSAHSPSALVTTALDAYLPTAQKCRRTTEAVLAGRRLDTC